MLESVKQRHQGVLDGIARLERQLPFRFALLSRLLDRQIMRLLSRHDMTLGPYRILYTIEAFGKISPAELARYVVIDKAQVSRATAQLQHAGLIEVVRDPASSRRRWLHLTAAGVAKLDALSPDITRRLEDLSAQLDPVEREVLIGALEKLTAHVAAGLERSEAGV